jgi:type I restriction enzyme, S subunit
LNSQPILNIEAEEYRRVRNFTLRSRWLCAEDSRFDATTYSREAFEALRILEASGITLKPLASFVRRVYHPTENQPRSNFKRIWVKAGQGVPFLTGKQLFFFRPDREKYVSEKMPKLHELTLAPGTVLVSRSGTTGFPVFVSDWLSQFAITDDAIRIFPGDKPIGFIYAYLASRLGRPLMTKSEYGSTVSHLEAKHILTVPVPDVDMPHQLAIDDKIRSAYGLRDEANLLLDEADEVLHETLGLSAFTEGDIEYFGDGQPRAFLVPAYGIETRFDATNHVPVVRSAIHKLQKARYPLVTLSKLCSRIFMPPRFKRNYATVDEGVPYLMPSHIVSMRRYGLKALSRKQAIESPEYLLRAGELLITTDGTVGRIHPVTRRMAGWFGSNNMVRLNDSDTNMSFLYAFLSTPYGVHQIKKDIYGGVVDHINEEHLETVLCPDVPKDSQKRVGELVQRAFELKDRADDIEEDAIKQLETIIRRT